MDVDVTAPCHKGFILAHTGRHRHSGVWIWAINKLDFKAEEYMSKEIFNLI